MPTRRDILVAVTALLTTRVAAQRAPAAAKLRPLGEIQDEQRKLIPDLMRRYKVPGLSLAYIRDRQITWAEAFGLRDKETNSVLTPETVFEAASLSKPAYSYVVLKLVELGKFNLERPLLEYLGRDLNPDEPRFRQVNGRHVLTHTSGIEPQPGGEGRPPKLVFAPGERFEYSPHAFDILQLAVEQAVGETIAPMMERMLLRPFGMVQSGYGWSEAFANSGARGYTAKGEHDQTFNEQMWRLSAEDRVRVLKPYPFESVPNAAAGLHSTPTDYARFLVEAMRPGEDDFHLAPAMHKQMLTPHVSIDKFDALSWGLGFGLQQPRSTPRSFWHWGDWGLFQHYAVAYPEEGCALVVMTNGSGLLACRDVALSVLGYVQPAFEWLTG
jgi:CubicO group peptidase (beta-lactamase class C family)